ncbi:NAD(P)/FAD-dependent oxidoreductase [Cellvibrio sp. KY-YJ-3]|uniref:NAD(P)/FAD-dependent oxidoreductase n=1 Tax=Cellvibrio sp. KY-YJ-3 TaxID=454662 RepID=UPI001247017E|nr:FAD/NAD(P)-binding oxidoreductase [Cellvibrio sp. KY-YJ-3]QEY12850.1 NAD(P)/FAD-dependent oxidoreductase [Cellvibrio sp. KY-YJ-3]
MTKHPLTTATCIIVGASHAGVNAAFALRKEGWAGKIVLIDSDPRLPYHRPPLSKTYITSNDPIEKLALKPEASYTQDDIELLLGVTVTQLDAKAKKISTYSGDELYYDKLILATGASPIVPAISGLTDAHNLFFMRNLEDSLGIKAALHSSSNKRVVIIGGGYIGLETAASLKKLSASVVVLERENRILARVTAPEMSAFFLQLHEAHGVKIVTEKNVSAITTDAGVNKVHTSDGAEYLADIIIVGVGVRINKILAEQAGLTIENGICVNAQACTSNENIYAIGDCSYHFNPHYQRHIRLESVQNAVDQAKIAALDICGKAQHYNALPWFWSDQYDVKLQMVGLSSGYDQIIIRRENTTEQKFSTWYFAGDELLAVDAINNAKAYVLGTKLIKTNSKINKTNLANSQYELTQENLLTTG